MKTLLVAIFVFGLLICGAILMGGTSSQPSISVGGTITGTAKDIHDPNIKMNPAIPNAVLTDVREGSFKCSNAEVYVQGGAGVICATKNGKKVEISNYVVVLTKDKRSTIQAESIDVKVVDDK